MGVTAGEFLFWGGGCEVHAVPRITARHTTTHNHSVTDDVLVVGTTEVPGLGLDFRSGACRFCATEAAIGAFPLLTCLPCPRGCLAVFLYTFLRPVATTTLALLSELLLSELDSDDVEDVPPILQLVPTASERGEKIKSGPQVRKVAT